MRRITQRFVAVLLLVGGAPTHAATLRHAQGGPEPSRRATSEVADAAMRGDRAAVRAALARKADVNAAQVDGTTALHWAVERDDIEMAELLIEGGARVGARTREGVTPLQLAATNGSAAMIGRLIRAGADPNAPFTRRGPARRTPFESSSREGPASTRRRHGAAPHR